MISKDASTVDLYLAAQSINEALKTKRDANPQDDLLPFCTMYGSLLERHLFALSNREDPTG